MGNNRSKVPGTRDEIEGVHINFLRSVLILSIAGIRWPTVVSSRRERRKKKTTKRFEQFLKMIIVNNDVS